MKIKIAFLSVALCGFVAFNTSAQTEAPAPNQQKAEKVQSPNNNQERRAAEPAGSRKDQFMQRLN